MSLPHLARTLNEARTDADLTIGELAARAGISTRQLNRYLAGSVPPLDVATRLARILDLSLNELVDSGTPAA